MERRTDVSPTSYSSVYEQLREFPSKIDEPELENELDLEEFSENWSKFLEEETLRELKEDYPAQLDQNYLEDQYERLEKVLEEDLYEYALVEFSSFFEEIFRRIKMQEKPFSEEYKDWLLKDCWNWKEASDKVLEDNEAEDVEELYELRNNFIHMEENLQNIREDSIEILDSIISLYNDISPYELDVELIQNDVYASESFYEKLNYLRESELEEYLPLELFRSLEKVEDNLNLDLKSHYKEEAEEAAHYANQRRWVHDRQFEDVKKAIEYRREIAHNIEPNKNVAKNEIEWKNVLDTAMKMHIIASIQETSILEAPVESHKLRVDTSLPLNIEMRSKVQEFVNSRVSLEQIPELQEIKWENLRTSTSTSAW